jgi:RNA polymerase sigma factor (sigma-70 family)
MKPTPSRPPDFSLRDVEEAMLVTAARAKDEAAVRELIRRLNPRLFRVARGILDTTADAEDAVQDAYLAAFTRLDQFRGESRFSTWLIRITINAARTLRREPKANVERYDALRSQIAGGRHASSSCRRSHRYHAPQPEDVWHGPSR